jgi:hypothetical protein
MPGSARSPPSKRPVASRAPRSTPPPTTVSSSAHSSSTTATRPPWGRWTSTASRARRGTTTGTARTRLPRPEPHPTRIMSRSCAAPNSGQPFMSASTAGLPRGHGDQLVPPTSSTERTKGRHHRHRQRLEIPTSVLQLHAPRGTPGPAKEAIRRHLPPHHEQGREAAATSGEKKKEGR